MKSKTKRTSGQSLRTIRSDLAALKAHGLWKGDARSAKGGWRQRKLINQYSDVLSGKASVLKVGTHKAAKAFPEDLRPHRGRVVVEKATKGEKLYYNKRKREIFGKRKEFGRDVRRIVILNKVRSIDDLPRAPKGQIYYYRLSFRGEKTLHRFTSPEAMREFMEPAYTERKSPTGRDIGWHDWLDYVEIDAVSAKRPLHDVYGDEE